MNQIIKLFDDGVFKLKENIRTGSWEDAYDRCEHLEALLHDLRNEINFYQLKKK